MTEDIDPITYMYATQFIGKPYIWGGKGPIGFDCSGLCIEILQSSGVLPGFGYDETASGLMSYFSNPDNGLFESQPRFGNLVFYGKITATHVAFCLDHRVIEAGGGNSTTLTPADAEKRGAMVRIRPWNYRLDVLTILRPTHPSFI